MIEFTCVMIGLLVGWGLCSVLSVSSEQEMREMQETIEKLQQRVKE